MSRFTDAYVQEGETLTLAAPYDRESGQGAKVGAVFGVAVTDVLSAADGEFETCGVFLLAKTSAQAWTQGQKIYWDDSNKRCDSDGTVGMLIGAATAAAANPSSTGYVKLNGTSPAMLEGPESAVADLTDNSGGATADGTIAVVTAPTALTDNGGGTADSTVAAMTAPTALTVTDGTGTNDGTIDAITNNATTIAAVQELAAKINTTVTFCGVVKDNFKELTTAQAANRLAIIALTDAVKELSTKQNALLAALRLNGVVAP